MKVENKLTLRQWRVRADLTQVELAKMAGLSSRTIASWEGDINEFRKAKYSNVERVANVLGIQVDNFILEPTSKILKLAT